MPTLGGRVQRFSRRSCHTQSPPGRLPPDGAHVDGVSGFTAAGSVASAGVIGDLAWRHDQLPACGNAALPEMRNEYVSRRNRAWQAGLRSANRDCCATRSRYPSWPLARPAWSVSAPIQIGGSEIQIRPLRGKTGQYRDAAITTRQLGRGSRRSNFLCRKGGMGDRHGCALRTGHSFNLGTKLLREGLDDAGTETGFPLREDAVRLADPIVAD